MKESRKNRTTTFLNMFFLIEHFHFQITAEDTFIFCRQEMGCHRNLTAHGKSRACEKEHKFLLKMYVNDNITDYKLVRHSLRNLYFK